MRRHPIAELFRKMVDSTSLSHRVENFFGMRGSQWLRTWIVSKIISVSYLTVSCRTVKRHTLVKVSRDRWIAAIIFLYTYIVISNTLCRTDIWLNECLMYRMASKHLFDYKVTRRESAQFTVPIDQTILKNNWKDHQLIHTFVKGFLLADSMSGSIINELP